DADGDGLDDGFDTIDTTGTTPDVNDNLDTGAIGTDNDDAPSTAEVDFREVTVSDLVVSKTVDNSTPNEGDTITYTIAVTNDGPSDATVVVVNDLLPAGVTYVSDTPSVGTYDDATGDWVIGTIINGDTISLDIIATVDAGTSGDTINNVITVTLEQDDPDLTNNDLEEEITVRNDADLVISKTVNNSTPNEGETITYTITVTNNGAAQATALVVNDPLPAGVTYSSDVPSQGSYAPASGNWDIGTLDNGDTATLDILASVDVGTSGDTINNIITVTLEQDDPDLTNNDLEEEIIVGNDADLVISKTVNNSTPNEGDIVTYTITVTNNGAAQATALVVNDPLPVGVTYVSDTPSVGTYDDANGDWVIGTLDSGDTITLDILASVDVG
ncbi:DUF11 domain-containing protein, partial [Aquimarina sp. MMG016]|uniref:DUF11 domain-containing protein n=1 Tax=Aquimarina sp. MMG016 TaxID=2822690 RepID=UPI001B3A6C9A